MGGTIYMTAVSPIYSDSSVSGRTVVRAKGISSDGLLAAKFLDEKIRSLREQLDEAEKRRREYPPTLLQVV